MTTIHNLGFPRIGDQRQLKFASESYWRGEITNQKLKSTAKSLRKNHWELQTQEDLDYIPVGDFSFYDQVLDTSFLLGNIPARFQSLDTVSDLDEYFRIARGRSQNGEPTQASEMTKWFDTNYHYIVPEFNSETHFSLNPSSLLAQIDEALLVSNQVKPAVLGPLSYLWLGKVLEPKSDGNDEKNTLEDKLDLLEELIPVYRELLGQLTAKGIQWVQIDEPILALDLPDNWVQAFERCYHALQSKQLNILLAAYFGPLKENLRPTLQLPVAGLHIDAVRGKEEVNQILDLLPAHKVLSLGIIDGRNIWISDIQQLTEWLTPIAKKLKERLWLAPSCSLLHVPVSLKLEKEIEQPIKSWLAFAEEKLQELKLLKDCLNEITQKKTLSENAKHALKNNSEAIKSRNTSEKTFNKEVRSATNNINQMYASRHSEFSIRQKIQADKFDLPLFPTTTIGSFPQTQSIRIARKQFKNGEIDELIYSSKIKSEIQTAISIQEDLDIDVFVHGEAERNDMVEYFGELLEGYIFSKFGWVQSYGSRCVKPPIIYGDVYRSKPISIAWSQYAQSLTSRPVKGMLTGPITMLQWAFVRNDIPREQTAKQIAMALREEVIDLEHAGIHIIQVDEPAIREGLPLRQKDWEVYLNWAVEAFKISTCGISDSTQIHTHMCYSEFNDIIQAVADLDADVITIETSRSNMELLDAFAEFNYPNDIGPGVYDIHSPNLPTEEEILTLLQNALKVIPAERLWVNPDCGLKTRQWQEVTPALVNMVSATKRLRSEFTKKEKNIAS